MYQHGYDTGGTEPNFGVAAEPTTVIITPDNIVFFKVSGYSVSLLLEHEMAICEGLGLVSPSNISITMDGGDVDLEWSFSDNSELYSFVQFNLYRNGVLLQEFTDSATLTYTDMSPPIGSYVYQMTTTYQKDDNQDLSIESFKSTPDEPLVVGDLGPGEWMTYSSNPPDYQLGPFAPFAYALEFDFGASAYLLKAIEVAHEFNGSVDWAVAEYGSGLVQGSDGELLGNAIVGDLSGTLNVFYDYVPAVQMVDSAQEMTGHVAVVVTADANRAAVIPEVNPLADLITAEFTKEWEHLTDYDLDYIWYFRILVEDVSTGKTYEITQGSVLEI